MVVLSRRLAALRPKLLDIRTGKGALQLPEAPVARLTGIHLQYPRYEKNEDGKIPDALTRATKGAYHFDKEYLPSIKYHNPGVKVEVATYPKGTPRLTLHFESTDREALRAIESPRAKKAVAPNQSKIAAARFIDATSTNAEEALGIEADEVEPVKTDAQQDDLNTAKASERILPNSAVSIIQDTKPARRKAPSKLIKVKKAAPVRASAPQTVRPPPGTLYERSISFDLNGRHEWEISKWFKCRTGAEKIPTSEEDQKLALQSAQKAKQAAIDRERMVKIQAVRDREIAAMKQVREAAERNAAEAAAAAAGG